MESRPTLSVLVNPSSSSTTTTTSSTTISSTTTTSSTSTSSSITSESLATSSTQLLNDQEETEIVNPSSIELINNRNEKMEEMRKQNSYVYTIACILAEKEQEDILNKKGHAIHTKDLNSMLDGGISKFYQKYSTLTKDLHRPLSTPEIRFEDLSYSVIVPKHIGDTVGRRFTGLFKSLAPIPKGNITTTVLHPMSGIIQAGSTTLLLGRPGSGKSSFLKALAGRLRTTKNTIFSGKLLYSGLLPEEVQLSKFIGYVDQTDQHCPILTVRETIQFADYCLNGHHKQHPEEIQGIAALRTDLLLHILGLLKQANTYVGDELLRGVSGGEKKRVTIGEMLVGGQSIFLCDEISTGLDSAAILDITKSLRSWTEMLGGTVVVALLQPPPEVVALFDNIVLLSEGHLVYHGPRESVLPYFSNLGYSIGERDLSEFLIDIVNNNADTDALENHFKSSLIYHNLKKELENGHELLPILPMETVVFRKYFALSQLANSKKKSPFALSFYESTMILCERQARVLLRDKSLVYGKLGEALVLGLLVGSIYYKAEKSLYLRMIFFGVAILQRQAWQQIPIALQLRNIFYKQRSRNFYPTLAFSLAEAIVQIPMNICVVFIVGTLFYFLSGLTATAECYFRFILILLSFQHAVGTYFSFLTSISPTLTGAQALAGISSCFFLLFSGNIILHDLIPPYWVWVHWFDPLAWALRCLILNEFKGPRYTPEESKTYLKTYQIHQGSEYIWIGIGILWSYFFFFTLLKTFFLQYLSFSVPKTNQTPAPAASAASASALPALPAPPTAPTARPAAPQSSQIVQLPPSSLPKDAVSIQLYSHDQDQVVKPPCMNSIPAYLTIRNLTYSVQMDGVEKILLSNVSAHFCPGTMTALMGASGAGKSTLLDVISGRKTAGNSSGDILVNGLPKDVKTFPRIAAYCEQMDIHSTGATVWEALVFSAMLRLPEAMSYEDKMNIVNEVVDMIELRDILHFVIGNVQSGGISVEQRKRLTVGVELVACPSILFLDEPTSGLDVQSALMVMKAVKKITKLGKTIICTIHQPNTQLFNLFDSIMLLQRGGRIVYFGNLENNSKNMLDYFAALPNGQKMPSGMNPATYILDQMGAGIGRETSNRFDLADLYECSELKMMNDAKNSTFSDLKYHKNNTFPPMKPMATSLVSQIQQTCWKTTKVYWRNINYNFVRLVLFPLFALIFGTTFYQLGHRNMAELTSQVAQIYLTMDFIGIINMMTVIEITSQERAVFYRERASNMYSALPYAIGLFVAEIPYLLIITGVFVEVEYWLSGLEGDSHTAFYYWFTFFLYTSSCTFMGQLMCILLPNAKVANIAVGAISCFYNIFSGYLVFLPNIPVWYKWITYILPSGYCLSSLVSSQFGICKKGTEFGCYVILVDDENTTIANFIKTKYDFDPDWRYYYTLILSAIWIFLQVLIYLTLRYVNHLKR